MTKKPMRLMNLKIREVSSVDRGAGIGVKVALMKRDDVDGTVEIDELPEPLSSTVRALYKSASSIVADSGLDDVAKQGALSETFQQFDGYLVETLKAAADADEDDGDLADAETEGDIDPADWTDEQRRVAEMKLRHARAHRQREGLKKDMEMNLLQIAKAVVAGQETMLTKGDFYAVLNDRAQAARGEDQCPDQAFAKYLETADGKVLYAALKIAKADAPAPTVAVTPPMPTPTRAYTALMAKAEELRKRDPKLTSAQAFSRAYEAPENCELVQQHKIEQAGRAA